MSYAEIINELPRLSPAQRDDLAARLAVLRRIESPAFLDEMDRRIDRIDRMEAGKLIAAEQIHGALENGPGGS